jgi:hypothetical protein
LTEKIQNGDFEGARRDGVAGTPSWLSQKAGTQDSASPLTRTGGVGPYAIQLDSLLLDPNARSQFVF